MTEPDPKRMKIVTVESERLVLTSANIQHVLQIEEGDFITFTEKVLYIPFGKMEELLPYMTRQYESDDEILLKKSLGLVINYWLLRCPNASWRWLVWQIEMKLKRFKTAEKMYSHVEMLVDPTLTLDSVAAVTSSVGDTDVLRSIFDITRSKMTSREEIIVHWLDYSPFATWEWLAGSLFYHGEESALRAVKPFMTYKSEPSLSFENIRAVFEEVEGYYHWTHDGILSKLQIPLTSELGFSSDVRFYNKPKDINKIARVFLCSHPAPSWELIAQALYFEGAWEAGEIVYTKYLRDINLQEMCIETISNSLRNSKDAELLPLSKVLKSKIATLNNVYPLIKYAYVEDWDSIQ